MNCEVCQRRLLATREPQTPAPEVQAHLADCPACRRWHSRLVRIEAHVPLLPVPPSHGKKRLLAQLLGQVEDLGGSRIEQGASGRSTILNPQSSILNPRSSILRSRLVLGAAAAAVLIVCGVLLGVLLISGGRGPDNELVVEVDQDLVAVLADCDVRLAEADTPRKRVEALADMADALRHQGQALRRADAEEEMGEVARLYEEVVREGVVARARTLPAPERRQVLAPIARRLARAEREARRLAGRADAPAAAPLLRMAEAARAGDRELREMIEEAP
jgi:hypothetical protein